MARLVLTNVLRNFEFILENNVAAGLEDYVSAREKFDDDEVVKFMFYVQWLYGINILNKGSGDLTGQAVISTTKNAKLQKSTQESASPA